MFTSYKYRSRLGQYRILAQFPMEPRNQNVISVKEPSRVITEPYHANLVILASTLNVLVYP